MRNTLLEELRDAAKRYHNEYFQFSATYCIPIKVKIAKVDDGWLAKFCLTDTPLLMKGTEKKGEAVGTLYLRLRNIDYLEIAGFKYPLERERYDALVKDILDLENDILLNNRLETLTINYNGHP